MLVSCSICNHFIKDKIGFGQGIGRCQIFETYIEKKPGKAAIRKALLSLGNDPDRDGDIFWGGHLADRQCNKYEGKE